MRYPRLVAMLGLLGAPLAAQTTGTVHDRLPARPSPRAQYLIYLHGRIIEEEGRRPRHPSWGTYEYDSILSALAARGFQVVSQQRPAGTDMDQYATAVAHQVRKLLAMGVPASHVAVVGFSKGGGIAIRVADQLQLDGVTFVLLGACGDGDFTRSPLRIRGRILSVYEESDAIGRSCQQLFDRSAGPGPRSELKIQTGREHGAFYQIRPEWLLPTVAWIKR